MFLQLQIAEQRNERRISNAIYLFWAEKNPNTMVNGYSAGLFRVFVC